MRINTDIRKTLIKNNSDFISTHIQLNQLKKELHREKSNDNKVN